MYENEMIFSKKFIIYETFQNGFLIVEFNNYFKLLSQQIFKQISPVTAGWLN